jgi:hypothetical protein
VTRRDLLEALPDARIVAERRQADTAQWREVIRSANVRNE